MASFIGGEALARVVRFNGATSVGWATYHTVPAGRYAKVWVLYSQSSVSIGTNSFTGSPISISSSSISTHADHLAQFPDGAYFDESTNIQFNSPSLGNLQVLILEFNKPDTLNLP
jgi:hypothetical protein